MAKPKKVTKHPLGIIRSAEGRRLSTSFSDRAETQRKYGSLPFEKKTTPGK